MHHSKAIFAFPHESCSPKGVPEHTLPILHPPGAVDLAILLLIEGDQSLTKALLFKAIKSLHGLMSISVAQ